MRIVSISGPCGRFVSLNNRAGAVIVLAVALGAGAVFGQGHTLWQDRGVQLCGTSSDVPMTATSDSAGGAIVVWLDSRDFYKGIYAQRVDAAGVPQWTTDGVLLCYPAWGGPQGVVDDGKHGAIALWGSAGGQIAVQRLSADGVPLWGPQGLILRQSTAPAISMPALVRDGRGGAIVVRTTLWPNSALDTLLACRVDSSGSLDWETCVRAESLGERPSLCPDGRGGAIVAWEEYRASPSEVRVQRLDSAGAVKWGSAGVPACTLTTTQASRVCVAVGESHFVVGWADRATSTWQNRAQMFDLAGWGYSLHSSRCYGLCWRRFRKPRMPLTIAV